MSTMFGQSTEAISRGTMNLFFICDTSGSMSGSKIGAMNDAIRNVIPIVKEISDNNTNAEIKISALIFNSDVQWIYSEPKLANVFEWIDCEAAGLTCLGQACRVLEKALHRQAHGGVMPNSAAKAPVFILLSDGEPNDDFEQGLKKLKENKWFKVGLKFAIAIGNDADRDVLGQFTGSPNEGVYVVHDIESLKTAIKIVTVTSSQVGSSHVSNVNGKTVDKQAEAMQKIAEEFNNVNESGTNAILEVGVDGGSFSTDGWD